MLLAACPNDGGPDPVTDAHPSCALAYAGDPAAPMSLEATAIDANGNAVVLHEGDSIALIQPLQGGRVVFVGARVKNVDPCAVKVSGAVRDEANGKVVLDARVVNLLADGSGAVGSVAVDQSSFANVSMCPNNWASFDLFDHPVLLTLTVTDRTGKTASVSRHVVPRCGGDAVCLCNCKLGYVLGQACPGSDAGPDGDAIADAPSDADSTSDATGDATNDAGDAPFDGGGG